MIISKNIEININETEITLQELRKLRNTYCYEKDYYTADKINEIIDLYEDFKIKG